MGFDLVVGDDGAGTIAFANGAVRIMPGEPSCDGLVVARPGGGELIDLDGIVVMVADQSDTSMTEGADRHPNGAIELDHLVITTDSLERTSGAITAHLDLSLKRVRDTGSLRQGFHRFAPVGDHRGCIIEVVETPGVDHASLMGWVATVADPGDLHRLADELGPDLVSPPKPAVQSGRMIATLRPGAGLGIPVALMTPELS